MAGTAVSVDNFKNIINGASFRNQVKATLKENASGFLVSMLDLYNSDTYLQKCDANEVAKECMKAAVLNLPLVKSLGFAYVVPYKNKPTFTIGYKGLIQLAQRTGQYKCINADVVYEGEFVGLDKLSGEIDLAGEKSSDKVVGYFAYIRLISGFEKVLYMSKDDVEKWAKKYSPSNNASFSPWKSEFDKMAQKTVLRRLIGTYGAMTTEMYEVLKNDDNGNTPMQELAKQSNQGQEIRMDEPIDSSAVEIMDDGEIIESDQAPEEDDF